MAITDKEGKVYKLRGPNPILRDQSEWDKSRVHLINPMGKRTEVVSDDVRTVVLPPKKPVAPKPEPVVVPVPIVIEPEAFLEELIAAPVEVIAPPVVEPPKPKTSVSSQIDEVLKKQGVPFHCVPLVGKKTHTDTLYDHTYTSNEYGNPFTFLAVIVDQSDLQLQIWGANEVVPESIIHRKAIEENCWKIYKTEPKSGGFIMLANLSDMNPSFE